MQHYVCTKTFLIKKGVRKMAQKKFIIDGGFQVNDESQIDGNLIMGGSILPTADVTYDLGSPTLMWKDIYVGPGSLYVDGQKVLESHSGTINVTADEDQSLTVKTSGTGVLTLQSASTVNFAGNLQMSSGSAISSNDGTVTFSDKVDLDNNQMINLGTPTDVGHAATKGYVDQEVANLINGAPGALDTLNELANALGDDANFASTVATDIATINTNASGMQAQITTLQSDVASNDADIVAINSSVTALQASASTASTDITALQTATQTNATDIAANATAVTNAISTASADATAKANAAEANAIATAATDASTKANAAQAAATTAAASDATTKANAAQAASESYTDARETAITSAYTAAISSSISSATPAGGYAGETYVDAEVAGAISAAASDATTKADAAQAAAIATASSDATSKADAAQAAAISAAASDATSKANAAQSAAQSYADSAVSGLVNGASAAFDTLKEIQDAMATDAELTAAINGLTIGNGTVTMSAGNGLSGGGAFSMNQTNSETVSFAMSGSFTGGFTATGDITAYSDESLKTNIQTIDGALGRVESIRGVTFDRIEDGSTSVGVVAQELEAVLPEAVKTDENGLKHVAYGNITGLLIEAVKELSAQVEELKK